MKSLKASPEFYIKKSIVLAAAFLSLGFLSGCSDIKTQIIANKQATAEKATRTHGPLDSATRADRSLWNLSRESN